jgi:hypothetical protein
MLDLGHMVGHVPGLLDLMLFLVNDVSVIHIIRCGLIRGRFSDKCVLTFILLIMIGDFKMMLDWAVFTLSGLAKMHKKSFIFMQCSSL